MAWYVESGPLAEIIEEWVAQHEREHPPRSGTGTWHGNASGGLYEIRAAPALRTLAEQTGIPYRRLYAVRAGEAFSGYGLNRRRVPLRRVTLDFADRLLTGIDHPEYWHTRLDGHVFEAPAGRKLAA